MSDGELIARLPQLKPTAGGETLDEALAPTAPTLGDIADFLAADGRLQDHEAGRGWSPCSCASSTCPPGLEDRVSRRLAEVLVLVSHAMTEDLPPSFRLYADPVGEGRFLRSDATCDA